LDLTSTRLILLSFIRLFGRLTIAAAWVFAMGLAAWNLARLYPGDRWLPVRLGNYFAPWLFMALAPALAVALMARRSWLIRLVLLLGLVFAVRYWPVLTPRLSLLRAEANTSELKVMTFNVSYVNRNAAAVASLIRAESPDIIAAQELTQDLAIQLQAELWSEYPYFQYDNSRGLTGLISRYPLKAQSTPSVLRRTHRAVAETPAGSVTVWDVHLFTALSQRGWESQKEMAIALAEQIEREEGPLIVLGDFNTTDQTENYRLIADRLTDIHWAIGRGFGFTFPDTQQYVDGSPILRPIVRIDHILVSEHFSPRETHVASSGYGSDHRPVVATVRWVD
jgi:vancomycin resistance protein VanJ